MSEPLDPPAPNPRHARLALAIVAGALGLEVGLMLWVGDGFYGDVLRAVRFGRDVVAGRISIQTHVDNTKTFVGPLLWFHLWDRFGLWGLRAFNLAAVSLLALVHQAIGLRAFGSRIALLALVFLVYYPGTHRNVAVGELDDNLAALLLGLSVLLLLRTRSAVLAGLLLGVAFLFKFWIAIFLAGLLLYLAVERRWRAAIAAGFAAVGPFLILDLASGGAGLRALFYSVGIQAAYSGWATIATRMFTTGLLPCFLVAGWGAWRKRQDPLHRLLFLVPAPYFAYVVLMRDAHAVTFVMTSCLLLWSWPIAEVVAALVPRRATAPLLVAYAAAGLAIATLNLRRDTHRFDLGDEVTAPRVAANEAAPAP
ncbi:MAG: hypothetical protein R3190_02730 [Thermoanaerobaculia bacterium]|nr:hypothetical protein [Thermoanaerobaculia bacterium]